MTTFLGVWMVLGLVAVAIWVCLAVVAVAAALVVGVAALVAHVRNRKENRK